MKKNKFGSSGSKRVGNSRPSSSRWFCFTMFNYSLEIIIWLQGIDGGYVFQEEICPDTGKEHLQGVVRFNSKKRLKTINKEYPNMHWEVCKNNKKAIAYCSKADTRKPNSTVLANIGYPETLVTITTLRPWQEKLKLLLEGPRNDRTINWYWETTGNVGKTSFARYLAIKHGAFYICGSAKDMKCGLTTFSQKQNSFPKIVILDIPRDCVGCSYKGLEQIKNGIFFSTKYESGMVVFNPPHIVVFANEEPDIDRMSKDRWNVVEILRSDVSS